MTGMIADSAALATLADIELPIPPEAPSLVLLVLTVLAVAAVIAILLLWQRRGAAPGHAPEAEPSRLPVGQQALQRLAALEAAWSAGRINDREAGFRLCTLLRLGLGLAQIDGARPPAGVDDGRWRAFVSRLREIRYRPYHAPVTAALFEQARDWLAPHPAPGHADV